MVDRKNPQVLAAAIDLRRTSAIKPLDAEHSLEMLLKLQESKAVDILLEDLSHNPNEKIEDFQISFRDVRNFLAVAEGIVLNRLRKSYFGDIEQDVFFGTNKASPYYVGYTNKRLRDDFAVAIHLAKLAVELREMELSPEEEEKVEEAEEEEEKKKTAVAGASPAAAVAAAVVAAEVADEQDQNSETVDQEQPPIPPRQETPQQAEQRRQSVGRVDRAYRMEALRMRQAILTSLARSYGLTKDTQIENFIKEFSAGTDELTPFILFELQKLQPQDLGNINSRLRLYRDVLLRCQAKGGFQENMRTALLKTLGAPKNRTEQQKKDEIIKKFEGITPEAIAKNVVADEAKNPSAVQESEAVLSAVAQLNQQIRTPSLHVTRSLEQELTLLLSDAKIPNSQIEGIFIRLQALAITKYNVDLMSTEKFEKLFGESLKNPALLKALQWNKTGYSWGDIFKRYVYATRADISAKTGLDSALYQGPDTQYASEVQAEVEKALQTYKLPGVVQGLYSSTDYLQTHAAAPPQTAGEQENSVAFKQGLAFKQSIESNIAKFTQLSKTRQAASARIFHTFSQIVFDDKHEQERKYEIRYLLRLASVGLVGDEEVGGDPYYLLEIGDEDDGDEIDGNFFYYGDDGEAVLAQNDQKYEEYAEQGLGKGKSFLNNLGEDLDRKLGKAGIYVASAFIPGAPAAVAEFYSTVDKLKAIPIIGPIIDELVKKMETDVAKIIKIIALILAGLAALAALVGAIIGGLLSKAVISAAGWIKGGLRGLASAGGSLLSNAIGALRGLGAGTSLLSSQLGALLAKIGPFSGAVVATTMIGVFSYQAFIEDASRTAPYLTIGTNTTSSTIYERRPQPPDIGCFTFVDDPTELANANNYIKNSVSNYTGGALQFTQAQMDAVAKIGGQLFSSDTYKNLLCKDGQKIRLVRVEEPGGFVGGWAFSHYTGGPMIALFNHGASLENCSQSCVDYTLTHESGHIIDGINGGILQQFAGNRDDSSCFPTYPIRERCAGYNLDESFAEAIAVYVVYPYYHFGILNHQLYDFPTQRPKEYKWVQEHIFGNKL